MNKRLRIIVVTLVLATSASYFIGGKLIQTAYYDNITKFNTSNNFNIKLVSYKRGLFSSEATLDLQVVRPNSGKLQGISFTQHISHGPILAIETNNGLSIKLGICALKSILANEWQQQLVSYSNQTQPLAINTVIKFNRDVESWIILKAVDPKSSTLQNLAWSTVTGFIQHDLNFSSYQGQISIPKITYAENNANFTISDATINFNAGNQNDNYFNSNVLHAKSVSVKKSDTSTVNFNNLSFKIDLSKDAQQNIGIRLVSNVNESQILDQKFAPQTALLQITNIKPANLPDLSKYHRMSPKALVDFMQQITAAKETKLQLELPKNFTEALVSFISFELYKDSLIGKFDKRPELVVRRDITHSINGLMQTALKQKLFLDQGTNYALNFDGVSSTTNKSS